MDRPGVRPFVEDYLRFVPGSGQGPHWAVNGPDSCALYKVQMLYC